MLVRKENHIKRRFKTESDSRKELNTLGELVEYIKDTNSLVYDNDVSYNSWYDLLDTGGRCPVFIDAHTDERGNTYFGVSDFKANTFSHYNEWAKAILRECRDHSLSDGDIDELVFEAVNEVVNDPDSYVDFYSTDIRLPCSKRDVDAVISKGINYIEKAVDDAEEKLIQAIKREIR